MATITNPFVSEEDAARYARARPYYHPHALRQARDLLGGSFPDGVGADVGTGTGMSALALREATERVVAFDISLEMLRQTRSIPGVYYVQARAEELPLADSVCSCVTAGAALHWFDQQKAFAEIRRILRDDGVLVAYTDRFVGELRGQPALQEWMESEYYPHHPSPPRHRFFDRELIEASGFLPAGALDFQCDFRMSVEDFAEYLLSQSNAIDRIAAGKITAEDLRSWIVESTSGWFPSYAIFRGHVWCARAV